MRSITTVHAVATSKSISFLRSRSAAARTIAGQYKGAHISDPTDTRRIPTYTEYDTHYDYSALFGGQLSLGVKNLFGSNRPIDDSSGFANRFNGQLYDQIGRLYHMGYAHTF